MKINWSFIEPVRDQAARLRGDFTAKSEIVKLAEQQAEIDRLREENARLREVLAEAHEVLHKLTAIIPGNDTAGEEVSRILRAARAAIREGGKE